MNTITKATTWTSSKPTSRSNPYASFNTTSRSKRTYSQKKQKKQKKQSKHCAKDAKTSRNGSKRPENGGKRCETIQNDPTTTQIHSDISVRMVLFDFSCFRLGF